MNAPYLLIDELLPQLYATIRLILDTIEHNVSRKLEVDQSSSLS